MPVLLSPHSILSYGSHTKFLDGKKWDYKVFNMVSKVLNDISEL